jgi:hypothetical protein
VFDAIAKGDKAAQVLDNEVYLEAVKMARDQIKQDWTVSKNQADREALWHKYQAIEVVTTALRILRDRGIQERKKVEK